MSKINTVDSIVRIKRLPAGGGDEISVPKIHLKKSFRQKLTSSLLIFVLLFQLVGGTFLLPVKEVEANSSDWLTGWDYRTPVMIDNNTETLTDYQTEITLQGTDSTAPNYIDFDKVLPGGADLRITDSDKITQIPYWIESWDDDAKTATVWTKVPTIPASSTAPYFKFSTSQTNHDDYGLSYPVTYEFNIPADSSNLSAYKKYAENGDWTQITEKLSTDFFNGIEAVRFDYVNNKAYVSVAFDANSNDIYLRIVDSNDTAIANYQKIAQYYDNREAAVVATGDDWVNWTEPFFSPYADLFTQDHIWLSAGIATASGNPLSWSLIQSKIDAGYFEPVSHSRAHPGSIPYADCDSEIGGSTTDLINNLDLPTLNKKGNQEYIYGWIEPGGWSDDNIRAKLGQYKYLGDRSVTMNQNNYATWDSINGLYNRVGSSIEADDKSTNCSWASAFPGTASLNNKFNAVVASGGVYNLYFHPACTTTSQLSPHLDYIKEKTNIWYAGFGHLYLYNFTREQVSQRIAVSGQDVYLYYGKSSATSLSNYDNVFTKDYGESGLVGFWHMDEGTLGSELLTDGGIEAWIDSTVLSNWTNDGGSSGVRDIAQETVNKQGGSSALKLSTVDNDGTVFGVWQDITTVSSQIYQVNFYDYFASRTAGTLKVEAWDNTHSVLLGSQSFIATNDSFDYASFRFASTDTTDVKIKIYLDSETTVGIAYIDSLSVKSASTSLTDSSNGGNTGTIYGASFTTADGGQWAGRSDMIFSQGSALQFDGVNDYVNVGNNASSQLTTAFTLSAWVKYEGNSSSAWNTIISKGKVGWTAPYNGFHLGYTPSSSRWEF
jgi:hypothetical protein